MAGREVPESWKTWKRDPSLPPVPEPEPEVQANTCPSRFDNGGVVWQCARPVAHDGDHSTYSGEVSWENEADPRPDGRVSGVNYMIQASQPSQVDTSEDFTEDELLEEVRDPANRLQGGGMEPDWMAVTQEESAAVMEALRQTGRWRTVLESSIPTPFQHWTTCLRHVEYNGRVCVCTRPAGHETDPLEDDGVEDPLHMDYNASVAWTSPDDIWDIQDPEPATWRDWFLTGTLDPRSLLVGLMGGLVVLVITLAAVFVKH